MPRCQLDLLGGWSLTVEDGTDVSLPTRKDRQLLAYLAVHHGQLLPRERLANLLWAGRADAQARDSLRQSLAALRKAFRTVGLDPVKGDRVNVGLSCPELSIDVMELADGGAQRAIARLCRGRFLEDMDTSTPEFEQWVARERQRFEALAEQLVCATVNVDGSSEEVAAALELGQMLCRQDPLLEPVCRAVMRLLNARGERVSALKVYASCREALCDELGAEPDPETEKLYRDILTGAPAAPEPDTAISVAPVHEKLSLAVLPLANLTGDSTLGFLCEGLAEDISTGLGRFRSLVVIDRYSAATVAAQTADTLEIGRRLGAALLVQGSLQNTPSRLRVSLRLVDSTSRAQTWSDVFDCAIGDAPGIPDQITRAIIATLENRAESSVLTGSQAKTTMAAYASTLRGIKHLRGYATDDNEKALALFRQALELDPDYALAQAYLAFTEIVLNEYDAAPRALLLDCKTRIDQALASDPHDGRIHWLLASVHSYLREFEDEKRQLERALALNPNHANAKASYGSAIASFGFHEEGVNEVREAMALNPFHPEWYWLSLGDAFLAAERYDDAIEAYKRRTRPKVWVLTRMAICFALGGRMEEARDTARRVLEQNPDFRISGQRQGGWSEQDLKRFRKAMIEAGLPD
ncbi:BTAD domain-containing putative transcriptional regulator [Roseobacter litoralis]|uniref:BTAD domain-containing putative transcriptional regulator n=1 Tax=Roseobacter litoralis TaxID=42443 RepID=UPI002494282E|nr:BTAD domain-containing putative transcriptional regulator [Roseobacter litoralis]